MSQIGLKIRQLRQSRNWSMERLGQEIGKKASSINGYEKGKNDPPLDVITKISQIFDVGLNYLLTDQPISQNVFTKKLNTSNLPYDEEGNVIKYYGHMSQAALVQDAINKLEEAIRSGTLPKEFADSIEIIIGDHDRLSNKLWRINNL